MVFSWSLADAAGWDSAGRPGCPLLTQRVGIPGWLGCPLLTRRDEILGRLDCTLLLAVVV